jgi:hypothetical protein
MNIVKNESNYTYIVNTIKRYCAFYIYLGIAYHYTGGRELYITNIIESGKNQKNLTFDIPNFYNSENNSKLITFFNDIKNILSLIQLGKTMDKIKIILTSSPLKYDSTIKLISTLDEDYFIDYIIIPDNLHNILKTLIFIQIYKKEEKNDILKFLNQEEVAEGEYKYIEVIQSNENKLIDFTLIQKFLTPSELRRGLAEEIYNFLLEQTRLENLQYAMSIVESQLNNNTKQFNEIYDNVYYIIIGTVLGIVIFVLFATLK